MFSPLEEPMPQVAKCGVCGSLLEFGIGDYGQTVEKCSNSRCINRHAHKPQPESLEVGRNHRRGLK